MQKTEANIAHNPSVLITLGSQQDRLHGAGAGFLIKGKASFVTEGPDFTFMKEKLIGCVPLWRVRFESATQTW